MKPAAVAGVLLLFAVPARDEIWPRLPEPKPGEWRWRHDEKPQTLAQYKKAEPKRPGSKRRFVYLLPAWTRPGIEEAFAPKTKKLLAAYFGHEVKRLSPRALPRRAYDARARSYSIRALVPFLLRTLPEDGIFLLALTDRDVRLPTTQYTYGWGSLKLRVGICSTWRLADDRKRLRRRRRYLGLVLHEATHMLSVPHCTQRACLMNGAMDLREADRRPLLLCWECRDKVCWNAALDAGHRYDALARAWTRAGLPEVAQRIGQAARVPR